MGAACADEGGRGGNDGNLKVPFSGDKLGWLGLRDPRPAARTGEGRSNIFLIPLYVWEGEGPAPSEEEEEEEEEGGAKRQMGGIRRPPDIFRPSPSVGLGWLGWGPFILGRPFGSGREGLRGRAEA